MRLYTTIQATYIYANQKMLDLTIFIHYGFKCLYTCTCAIIICMFTHMYIHVHVHVHRCSLVYVNVHVVNDESLCTAWAKWLLHHCLGHVAKERMGHVHLQVSAWRPARVPSAGVCGSSLVHFSSLQDLTMSLLPAAQSMPPSFSPKHAPCKNMSVQA